MKHGDSGNVPVGLGLSTREFQPTSSTDQRSVQPGLTAMQIEPVYLLSKPSRALTSHGINLPEAPCRESARHVIQTKPLTPS